MGWWTEFDRGKMVWSCEIQSRSVAETLAIGRRLGGRLAAGDIVGLVGPLGAGKTHLVKGVALGLGVGDDRLVRSPTFVLMNEYEGRLPIFHIDAYRMNSPHELAALGFEEVCAAGGVVLVEWADRVEGAIDQEALWIELTVADESERRMVLRTASAGLADRLADLGLDRRC